MGHDSQSRLGGDPADDPGERPREITRRDLLKGASAVGAAAVTGGLSGASSPLAEATSQATPGAASSSRPDRPYEHLTVDEAELLEAIADQLIPADDLGPGAVEAQAVRYIDRALGGALSGQHDAYRVGLAAFDRYCRSSRGASFVELPRTDQISALVDVETGAATGAGAGFVGSSATFFAMVRSHVIEGTFGDPFYGGNAGFVGWDLIRYPGVRTAVTPRDQARLERGDLPPYRRSAYDWDTFEKAVVSRATGEGRHGD